MNYYNLGSRSIVTSFSDAVIQGIAPDRSLYFPKRIPQLSADLLNNIANVPLIELAIEALNPFTSPDLSKEELRLILENTLDFEFPLVEIGPHYTLELFHGPTLAFKDVGARFMAQCLGKFAGRKNWSSKTTVLVATSGDTGGAVANGFLDVEGVDVVILFPEGKVSEVQELQMTTLGQNITALEVKGSFDDCQSYVKSAFVDKDLVSQRRLTSANSINVARWLPQMLYYFAAYQNLRKLGDSRTPVFSVPSGNFGNICAGMMAKEIGLPLERFIAATNINDTVVRYLNSKVYEPKPTTPTLSNAMDVSDPSNFIRIEELFKKQDLERVIKAYRFDDSQTLEAMRHLFKEYAYVADPHGAIGYLGLEADPIDSSSEVGIFLETAHPVKFDGAVKKAIDKDVVEPESVKRLRSLEKVSKKIESYTDLKDLLSSN